MHSLNIWVKSLSFYVEQLHHMQLFWHTFQVFLSFMKDPWNVVPTTVPAPETRWMTSGEPHWQMVLSLPPRPRSKSDYDLDHSVVCVVCPSPMARLVVSPTLVWGEKKGNGNMGRVKVSKIYNYGDGSNLHSKFVLEKMDQFCMANFCITRIGPEIDMPSVSVSCQTPSSARRQKRRANFAIGMNGKNFKDPVLMFLWADSSQTFQVRGVDGLCPSCETGSKLDHKWGSSSGWKVATMASHRRCRSYSIGEVTAMAKIAEFRFQIPIQI